MRRSWPPLRISRASNLAGNAFVPLERSRALTEPIGGRIIEVSNDDPNIFDGEPGNPRIGWTTYVPPGSVAKGREIVTTGGVMRVGSRETRNGRIIRGFDAGGRGKSDRTGHGVDYRISRLPAPGQNVASSNAAVAKRDALAQRRTSGDDAAAVRLAEI